MKARLKRPWQKVRTPICREDSKDSGTGLNLDNCTMMGGLFWTTYLHFLGLHRGVCSRNTRRIIFGSLGHESVTGAGGFSSGKSAPLYHIQRYQHETCAVWGYSGAI